MSEVQHSTRDRILETALHLFSAKGYLGATTKEISAESGVAEVTLFRHFSSKEILFEEMLAKYTFLPALREIMPSVKTFPYEEALAEIARKFLETLTLRKDLLKILHSEVHTYPEKIRKIYHAFIQEIFSTLAAYFNELQKNGTLKPFDALLGARAFLGMFFAYFTSAHIFMFKKCRPDEMESLIREYVQFFVHGTIQEGTKHHG
jgi:AcrR family transcriptional regulator